MICRSWTEPVDILIEGMPVNLAGLWSLLATGALAAAELAMLPVIDDDRSLTRASQDLRAAADALEKAHPHLPVLGVVLDVGRARLDDVTGCRTAVDHLIIAALRTTTDLLDQEITTAQLLALSWVVPLMVSAHTRVTARPW